MKKISYIFVLLISFCLLTIGVKAAPSASLSVSTRSVENGKSVTATVTLKNAAAWNIRITSSGNTSGCTQAWADATSNGGNTTKSFSTTCKATSLGTIAFVLSGDVTSADGSNTNVSGTQRVSVVEPRKASTNNALKVLSVEGYEISPEFDSEVLEYSVSVPSTVNNVKINATKQDSYASVDGAGEKEVIEGANKFEILVTAENGSTRTYSLVVNVIDDNPIKILNGLTVVKNSKYVEIPEGYVEEKTTVNGVEVPAFRNETLNIVLIAVRDDQGNNYFYEVKNNSYYKFVNLNATNISLYPQEKDINIKGFEKTTINISDNEITAYKYKNLDNYYLIYAKDLSTNEEHIYMYDFKNGTYQIFNEELFNLLTKDNDLYLYILCGALGVIFLCIIIIISLLKGRKRRVRKEEVKKEDIIEEKKEIKKEISKEDIADEIFEDLINDVKKDRKKKNKKEDIDL